MEGLSESVWQHVQRPHNPQECQHLAAVERNSWTTGLKHGHLHILKPNDASNSRLQWGGGRPTSFSVRTRVRQSHEGIRIGISCIFLFEERQVVLVWNCQFPSVA